jgi:hypothetical protein
MPLIIIAIIALIGLIAGGVFLLTRNQPDKVVQDLVASSPPFVLDRARRAARAGHRSADHALFDKPMDRASVENASDHAQSGRSVQVER